MSAAETTADTGALERRREVLELTGWGLPFRLRQPHNLCFWLYVVFVVLGAIHFIDYFDRGASVVGVGLGAGATATALYGLIFLALLRLGDHYERQPRNLVLTAFVWGAIPATFLFALTANTAMLAIYPKLFGQAFATDWAPALTAPFTEETSKAAGFILLLGLAPRLIRTPYDGVFLGAFIGLGFQLFEDVLYDFNSAIAGFGADQLTASLGTFGLRAASGIFSHTLYSALFCCGLIYAIGTAIQPRRLGLMLLGMLAHGTWDGIAAIGAGTLVGLLGVIAFAVLVLVLLFVVMRRTGRQERDFLRAVLAPEVANGTLTEAELDAVCSSRRQRKRFIRSGKGHRAHHNAKHVLHVAFDLAHEIALAHGHDSPGVQHERAEIARVRTLPTTTP
ncbi:MAG TPA: PrsW family intramembrane metalloprotease [Solirubrobacter sp.]|nr:PrsW family intramembrane metalloprotease [Solirubrobacter sp.]